MPKSRKNKKASDPNDIEVFAEVFLNDPTDRNFTKLMDRVEYGLKGYVGKFFRNEYDVNDAVSRIMEKIYYEKDSYDSKKGKFSTWAYAVAKNECLKNVTSAPRCIMDELVPEDISVMYDLDVHDGSMFYPDFAINTDIIYNNGEYIKVTKDEVTDCVLSAVAECIDMLPDDIREVVELRYVGKVPRRVIASEMGVPVNDVNLQIQTGMRFIRRHVRNVAPIQYDLYLNFQIA